MAKAKRTYDYRDYPKRQGWRGGCKVSWYYYAREADARHAAEAAVHNGKIQEGLGYDFGYCCPGEVRKMPDDNPAPYGKPELKGLWEVCIP